MAESMLGRASVAVPEAPELREEAAWVARARGGDTRAFELLLDRYRARAVRLAAGILRRPDEAEDAAQEAFIQAFRSIGAYRGEGQFYTWLYHIVLSVCLNRLKKMRRREAHDALIARTGERPAVPGEEAELHILVESLLAELTPVMRGALVLREVESLEYSEIARALRIPVGTVRSRLSAARERFRRLYEDATREASDV